MKQYKQPVVLGVDPQVGSGSAVWQEDHSAPWSEWSAQSWSAGEWSEHTHGYGVTSGSGATSIVQPIDTDSHEEISAAWQQDEGNQENRDGNYENRAVRFSERTTVHYTDGRSSDAASDPGSRPPSTNTVQYAGGDSRRTGAQDEAAVAARAEQVRWKRDKALWWRSTHEWSSRSSNK